MATECASRNIRFYMFLNQSSFYAFQLQYFYSFQLHYFCNCLFIYKHFCSKAPSVFSHVFILASNTLEQNTRFASHGPLIKPTFNTSKYGTNAFVASAIASWNFFQKEFPSNNMRQISLLSTQSVD